MSEHLSQRLIGYRVKAAREAFGWTQDQLAEAMGLKDRQSISDIENGKRALKPDELVLLTDTLEHELDFFLDPFQVAGEAQFSWRASPGLDENSLDGFELRAGQWIGLLRWLREKEQDRSNPLKQSLRLTAQSSYEDAITRAESLVDALDLGVVPAERLAEKIEQELDIPVLYVDTIETPEGDSISGATCHLQDMGVILINRNEPEARRFFDMAHELFHALTWDAMKPDHRESNSFEDRAKGKRIEQLANNFAAALLMPQASLAHLIDKRQLDNVGHLAEVAMQLRVAPVALAWRLFNLSWIDAKTREALIQERQRPSVAGTPKRFSPAFINMLHRAIDRGHLSARKAAKAVGVNLAQLVDLFAEHSLSPPFEL
ncbi:MAG: ImmA/IrrE family metallo-endopeptidase [Gammaproteobacteria bacterium]|nr:ImmA/IrrE family metallo-endopeptidase [Gammaproteobacteria bacterium]